MAKNTENDENMPNKSGHLPRADYNVQNVARNIQRILKDAGVYTPMLTYQVEITAGDLLLYRKIRTEALDSKTEVYQVEYSREGNPRTSINPIFAAMTNASNRVTQDFEKLTMNIKDNKRKDTAGNKLQELITSLDPSKYDD
jgi:hypothetical protein